jgi:stress response protein YsnF
VDRPVSLEEAKKGFEERTVEVSATVERPVVSKEARVVEEVAVGKTAREREEVVRDTVRRSARSRSRTRHVRTRRSTADQPHLCPATASTS